MCPNVFSEAKNAPDIAIFGSDYSILSFDAFSPIPISWPLVTRFLSSVLRKFLHELLQFVLKTKFSLISKMAPVIVVPSVYEKSSFRPKSSYNHQPPF